mmetsp:Transcript_5013/g.20567  ORF Transcript_5013/g.20567 Transcript_5013/m.20567 type:complete len:249 (+) Transcript_5013:32-778(+)
MESDTCIFRSHWMTDPPCTRQQLGLCGSRPPRGPTRGAPSSRSSNAPTPPASSRTRTATTPSATGAPRRSRRTAATTRRTPPASAARGASRRGAVASRAPPPSGTTTTRRSRRPAGTPRRIRWPATPRSASRGSMAAAILRDRGCTLRDTSRKEEAVGHGVEDRTADLKSPGHVLEKRDHTRPTRPDPSRPDWRGAACCCAPLFKTSESRGRDVAVAVDDGLQRDTTALERADDEGLDLENGVHLSVV